VGEVEGHDQLGPGDGEEERQRRAAAGARRSPQDTKARSLPIQSIRSQASRRGARLEAPKILMQCGRWGEYAERMGATFTFVDLSASA